MKRQTTQVKKDQILSELVEVRRKILDVSRALAPAKRDEVFLGVWSMTDLLAHLLGWDLTNIQAAQEILAGQLPSFYAHYDRDWKTYNARLVAEHRQVNWAGLLSSVQASHRQLVEFLETIPAAEFDKDRGVRFRGYKVTLARTLQAEIDDEQIHYQQISKYARA